MGWCELLHMRPIDALGSRYLDIKGVKSMTETIATAAAEKAVTAEAEKLDSVFELDLSEVQPIAARRQGCVIIL